MSVRPLLRFMAWPGPSLRASMSRTLAGAGLDRRLGSRLFAPQWWRQSLSLAYTDDVATRRDMLDIGASLSAAGFTMRLDRIASTGNAPGRMHWSFRPHAGVDGFDTLTATLRDAFAQRGYLHDARPTPHVTFSYDAPGRLPTLATAPMEWTIDAVHLVARDSKPFRYGIIASWPLRPAPRAPLQASLPFRPEDFR